MKYKLLLCSFCICCSLFSQTYNRQQLRDQFLQASERRSALDSFITQLDKLDKKTPAEECYYGICNGLCCQYDEGNWSKLKHVVKAKNALNSAVEKDSKDPELRFMRLMLEHFLPSFLGFNKHIPDDVKVIIANPNFIDENVVLKKKVIEFMLWSKRCSPEQNKLLEAKMQELNKRGN